MNELDQNLTVTSTKQNFKRGVEWFRLLIILSFLLSSCIKTRSFERSLIESRLNDLIPQSHKSGPILIVADNPRLLNHTNKERVTLRLSLSAEATTPLLGITVRSGGELALSARFLYNSSDRGFYIADPMVDELEI